MRYRVTFIAGLAAGYVLGAKAGRRRYEQIKKFSNVVSSNPKVKSAADAVQAQASQLGTQARRVVQEKAGSVGQDLVGKVSSRFGRHEIDLDAEANYANGSMT